jgi:penicillin-binding protein 1A
LVKKGNKTYALEQLPKVNGSFMSIEHSTGRVLALVGGYDFNASKFNRATQAKRQPGSLIKPYVYISGLEQGFKPNDVLIDEPIELQQGPALPLWTPKNHDSKFLGPLTFRQGLEKSRNIITIKVSQSAGINNVADVIQRFGINDNPMKVNSIVLGSLETTLERMCVAFGTIANRGYKISPHYIELIKDRKGNVIYK